MTIFGCASAPLNPPSGMIGGIPAAKSKLVVSKQQKIRVGRNIAYVFPAGEYKPAVEDNTGVYYEAPSRIIMIEYFLGELPGKPLEGGIFLHRNNPADARPFYFVPAFQGGEIFRMIQGGRPYKDKVPPTDPIQFKLTQS